MSWTQPVCNKCFRREYPDRPPVRVVEKDSERCCYCGVRTTSGIYIRRDPATVPYPRQKAEV